MIKLLYIGLGGFIGSVARYGLSRIIYKFLSDPWMPYGTLVCNITGCFTIGLAAGFSESRQIFGPDMRLFLFVGLLGGFTTFSSFGFETFELFRENQVLPALFNILLSVFAGLLAVALGFHISRAV